MLWVCRARVHCPTHTVADLDDPAGASPMQLRIRARPADQAESNLPAPVSAARQYSFRPIPGARFHGTDLKTAAAHSACSGLCGLAGHTTAALQTAFAGLIGERRLGFCVGQTRGPKHARPSRDAQQVILMATISLSATFTSLHTSKRHRMQL